MTYDLEGIFDDLGSRLPTIHDNSYCIVLSSENLPIPPTHLTSDRLYIQKGIHQYGYSYRVDALDFYAHKETYTYLGLLFLAALFNPQPSEVVVELTHSASDIKNLVIEYQHRELKSLPGGYHPRPYGFVYFPREMGKHPFDMHIAPRDLPCFALTNMNNYVVTEDDLRNRDTIRSFGNDFGCALFAELLLNAGQLSSSITEYNLEGEGGFRGVGIHSAEVRLFLPGDELFWDDSKWQLT